MQVHRFTHMSRSPAPSDISGPIKLTSGAATVDPTLGSNVAASCTRYIPPHSFTTISAYLVPPFRNARSCLTGKSTMPRKEAANAFDGSNRLSEYGLHVVVPRDPNAPECIDIVAVHGLNGHWETTWTDETTGNNWLKDSIPAYIPNARVKSFSYDFSVQLSKAVSDVSDFADQLLAGLGSRRLSEAEQERPVVFICHSLGGIVFKQACSPAQHNHSLQRRRSRQVLIMLMRLPRRLSIAYLRMGPNMSIFAEPSRGFTSLPRPIVDLA
jgi:hypothetical protein